MINTVSKWLGRLSASVAGTALVLMMLAAFVDSVGRKFNRPLDGAEEYVSYLLLIFFFASLPLVVRDDSHIRVGLLADLYKGSLIRIERVVTAVCELACLGVFVWMIFDQADRLSRFGTLTVHFLWPVAPWVYVSACMALVAMWFMALTVIDVLRGKVAETKSHEEEVYE
jgi:TRAP-type C4-dicarboxylate transport system permease small subunit